MLFNSLTFVLFIIVVHLVYSLPLSWEKRKNHLWLSSYIFYAAWNPPFVVLLWISTLIDWISGKRIAEATRLSTRRLWLLLSLATNLGLLGYFKYGGFLLESFTALINALGVPFQPAAPSIILPVGISFYTFQSLSYSFDIYRGKLKPWSKFQDFAFFVTFFPQLVAGPIVRAVDFLPQCQKPRRATPRQFGWGASLFTIGLFEKVVLADGFMAPVVDEVFSNSGLAGTADGWLGIFAFSGQVFFDFSGYSLCAIGVAMTFGFVLPDNFRFPYAAIGFSDLWQRWHISLSSWLRDYLYIPLGGNRRGELRTYANMMITMLLGGLWHGASWTYVAWGGLHGLYLMVERFLSRYTAGLKILKTRPVRLLLGLLTFCLVTFTYLFFRAESFGQAYGLLQVMFIYKPQQLVSPQQSFHVVAIIITLLIAQGLLRNSSLEELAGKTPLPVKAIFLAGALLAISLQTGGDRAFIYFQF